MVARSLHQLTEKGGVLRWSTESEAVFVQLGKAPVLQSLDLTKPLIVDNDLSIVGISVILSE